MDIKISCTGTENINHKKLSDFQGELKTINQENLNKLKNSIIENGFTAPIFIWKDKKTNYIIDGHQRLKALNSLFQDGYNIPDIPVVFIKAKDKKEAKRKLLYISSQYGEFLSSEYINFTFDLEGIDNIRLTNIEYTIEQINEQDLEDFFEEETDNMGLKEKLCPHCGGVL